jgi:hypothetical protein
VKLRGDPRLEIHDGLLVSNFDFEVVGMDSGTLRAEPHVVLDRGFERPDERPIGADIPEVIGWYDKDSLVRPGAIWEIGDGIASTVRVTQPARSALTITIKVD